MGFAITFQYFDFQGPTRSVMIMLFVTTSLAMGLALNETDIQSRLRYQTKRGWMLHVRLRDVSPQELAFADKSMTQLQDCFRGADRLAIVQMSVPSDDFRLRINEGKIFETCDKKEIETAGKLFNATPEDSSVYGYSTFLFLLYRDGRLDAAIDVFGTRYVQCPQWKSCAKLSDPEHMKNWLKEKGANYLWD